MVAEWVLAGRELPGDDAEHEDVGTCIRFLVAEDFRRHVTGRARNDPRLREPRAREIAAGDALRQPEVQHLDLAVLASNDVFRLQIAVNDVPGMCRRQRRRKLYQIPSRYPAEAARPPTRAAA